MISRLEAEGITLRSMEQIGLDDEPVLRKIHEMSFASAHDVPSTEEFGEIPFEVWLKWISAPASLCKVSWVAFDGDRPVGVASVSRRGEDSSSNDYTGVDRAYRGRGIAHALKFKTVESARETGSPPFSRKRRREQTHAGHQHSHGL